MDGADLERQLEELHAASFAWALSCSGGNRQEAEELLQDVYLKVLEGRARFGGRSTLKTWLFGVIRRTAVGRSRRRSLRAALLFRWGRQELAPAPASGVDERIERRQEVERVRTALRALSPRQRQVLELVFFHELTVREAATAMGVSLGTASLHYDRGKRRLARLVGQQGCA